MESNYIYAITVNLLPRIVPFIFLYATFALFTRTKSKSTTALFFSSLFLAIAPYIFLAFFNFKQMSFLNLLTVLATLLQALGLLFYVHSKSSNNP